RPAAVGAPKSTYLGDTPRARGVSVPVGSLWFVRPKNLREFGDEEMEALAAEVKKREIPGLALGGYSSDSAAQISVAGLAALKDLTHLKYLELRNCSAVSDRSLNQLAGLKNLRYLDLEQLIFPRHADISAKGLRHLADLDNLVWLNLRGCRVGDDGLAALPELRSLRSVNLEYNDQFSVRGIAHLVDVPELRQLDLSGNRGITDEALPHLAKMTKLEELDIGRTDIKGEKLDALGTLRNLRALSLQNLRLKGEYLAKLEKLTSLESLDLSRRSKQSFWNLQPKDLEALQKLRGLKRLTLNHRPVTDEALAALVPLPKLEYLDLQHCEQITDAGLRQIKKMTALRRVLLYGTNVSFTGKRALEKARPLLKVSR
ncbi:MAG: hypothetical protein R6V58_04110, partial [Planctomycetota bacterium]